MEIFTKNKNKLKNIEPKVLLFLIIVFAIFLRLIFFVGPCCDDDVAYLNSAHKLLKLDFSELRNGFSFGYRIMMSIPIALSFKFFGISEFSASLYILLTSIGSLIITFYIGRMLFNATVGLIAAFLLSFYPLEVIYSTHIVPDVPLAFFIGLGVLIFIYAEEKTKKDIYYFFSGLIIGIAYLVKITTIIIFPFILIYSIFFSKKNKNKSTILKFFSGFGLIIFTEALYSFYFTGDILMRYHSHISAQTAWGLMKNKSIDEIKVQLRFYPNVMLGNGNNLSPYCGIFFWLLLISFIVLFSMMFDTKYKHKIKRREFFIVLLWFFSVFLYLQFGTMDIKRFILIHRLIRFLTLLSIPMSLIIAYFLTEIDTKKPLNLIIVSLFVLILLSDSVMRINSITNYENNQVLGDVRHLYRILRTLPKKDVYFYQFTREFGLLEFYFDFDEENRLKLLYDKPCDSINNSYVVTDDNRWFFEGGPKYPVCFKNPPDSWKLIAVIKKANEGIYGKFDPKIYLVE